MTSRLRRLGKHVAIYAVGAALLQGVNVIIAPVLTRVMDPAGYGVLEILTVTLYLAGSLVTAGINPAIHRSFFDNKESSWRRLVVSTGLISISAAAIIVAVAGVLLAPAIARALLGDGAYAGVAAAAFLSLPFLLIAASAREVLRLEQQPWRYLTSSAIAAALSAAAGVALVLLLDSPAGVFFGSILGTAVSLSYTLPGIRRNLTAQFSRRVFAGMARYGLPLVPGAIAAWAVSVADRFILLRYAPLSEVGQYAIANRVANIVMLLTATVTPAVSPTLLQLRLTEPKVEERLRAQILTYGVVAVALIGVPLGALAPEVVTIFAGVRYLAAAEAIPPLILGLLLLTSTYITSLAHVFRKRTGELAVLAVLAAGTNITLCFLLIPSFGMRGAAIAALAAFAVQAVLTYRRAQALARAPFAPVRLIALLLLATPYLALGWVRSENLWVGAGVKGALLLTFPALLFGLRIVDPSSMRSLRET